MVTSLTVVTVVRAATKNGSSARASASLSASTLPPDRVPAGAAGRDGGLAPERALVAAEGGEDDSALVRLMAVVEEEAGHVASLAPHGPPHIGATP